MAALPEAASLVASGADLDAVIGPVERAPATRAEAPTPKTSTCVIELDD